MRTWARGTSRAAVLTAGFVAFGVTAIPANAFVGTGSVNQVDLSGDGAGTGTKLPVGQVKGLGALSSLVSDASNAGVSSGGTGSPVGLSMLDTRNLPGDAGLPDFPVTQADVPAARPGVPATQKVPGVPDGTALPSTPVVPSARTAGTGLQGLEGLQGTPGIDGVKLPSEAKTSEVVPVTSEIGPLRRVAAEQPIVSGTKAGSMWVLGAAGLLAAVAGALALARRIRLGRR